MVFNLIDEIVQGAKAVRAKPYQTTVATKEQAIALANQLEEFLASNGFTFIDIEGDKFNSFCKLSRKGARPIVGSKRYTHACVRVFVTRTGSYHTDLTVQ
jgi:hypothetical protein